MASTRTLLRSLQDLGRIASPSCRYVAYRQQSSWVSAARRRRQYNPGSTNEQQRPIVNGKPVAFHINDLLNMNLSSIPGQTSKNKEEIKTPRDYDSDLIVVLDLDECLVHSQFANSLGSKYAYQVRSNSAVGEAKVDTFKVFLPDGEMVQVHERPHIHEFLAQVSERYETHVFTAATEVYAKPVLKKLDPHGSIFTKAWYRDSCTLDPSVGAYVKNLGFRWDEEQLKRVVLVDNNPLSFLANPTNGLLVSNFYNDPKDTTLPVVLDLLHHLDKEEDVRPVLDARFGLRQALSAHRKGLPFGARKKQLDEQQDDLEDQSLALASN